PAALGDPLDLARRGAGLDLDRLLAVKGLQGDAAAEGGHRHRHLDAADQVVAAPVEDRVGVHGQLDDQVPWGPAELAGVAAALVADLAAVLEARGNVDGEGGVLHQQPLALALRAGRADLLAGAGAHRAGGGGAQLAEQRLADGALLAGAVAARADGRLGARLGPGGGAARADGRGPGAPVPGGG